MVSARRSSGAAAAPVRVVDVEAGPLRLPGTLTVPEDPRGIVVFVHGSGSSRMSPRNTYVADALNDAGFATLLFDLLTEGEEADRRNVFDIDLLADRLEGVVEWLEKQDTVAGLAVGLFGASTGAAAALVAAERLGPRVAAVVSRGGRPDLAGDVLGFVRAPVLLVVGGNDTDVLALNRIALTRLAGEASIAIVPGATHLFPEPGALDRVVALAGDWFETWLAGAGAKAAGG
jgi:alpha-beta hydrolase superfamily lysophospholipase